MFGLKYISQAIRSGLDRCLCSSAVSVTSVALCFMVATSCVGADAFAKAPSNSGSNSKHRVGDANAFDFYNFSMFWLTDACQAVEWSQTSCGFLFLSELPTNTLYPHGLWPTKLASGGSKVVGPSDCAKDPLYKSDLSLPLKKRLYDNGMADYVSLNHEWEKHGTCSPFSKEQFFTHTLDLADKLRSPDVIIKNIGGQVAYKDLITAYGGPNCAQFICRSVTESGATKQYLYSVSIPLEKETLEVACNADYLASIGSGGSGPGVKVSKCDPKYPVLIREPSLDGYLNS